jgi:serine-type D-Ala-D-Ala carboxypeptidase/endopeptidase (penicillin-binding protein 4)
MARLTLILALLSVALPAHSKGTAPRGVGEPALVAAVDPLLDVPALEGARMSLLVVHLPTGRRLFAHHADRRLHPASNTKVVTTAAALTLLGPEYTWRTDLAVDKVNAKGEAGTAWLIGGGDPRFVSESLWSLVEAARLRGLKTIKGDLVVDERFFGPPHEAPGYGDKQQDSAYRAPSGGLSLNWNAVRITIKPGAKVGAKPVVTLYPDGGYVTLVNKGKTTKKGRERLAVSARAHKGRTKIVVSGRIPIKHAGVMVRRRIDHPGLFAGHAAREWLKRAGIKVKGKVVEGKARKKRKRLARVTSRSLAMAAMDVNKLSNNIMAEHLLRTLGRVKKGTGDWDAGRTVVTEWLEDAVGIKGFTYRNGSGLFGDTAFSATELVAVLRYMHTLRPPLPEFAASLAVGGADGTLKRRMKALPRRAVRGKTGTLNGVICLTGYVTVADGSQAAFSFLMNDVKAKGSHVWRVQDGILAAVAKWSPRKR